MEITLILHNIRSTHNVGSILRTADGFGVSKAYLCGYTPYPAQTNDTRLPYLRDKITSQIHKTALGAEATVPTEHTDDTGQVLKLLKKEGYTIVALEQAPSAIPLPNFRSKDNIALLLGEEVHGIPKTLLTQCGAVVEIPMQGKKESFNVSVAAGIALYQLTRAS